MNFRLTVIGSLFSSHKIKHFTSEGVYKFYSLSYYFPMYLFNCMYLFILGQKTGQLVHMLDLKNVEINLRLN